MSSTSQIFQSYVERNLDALGERPGLEVAVHEGRRITAGEFRDLVYRMARVLRERGVGRGQTVTLLSGNLPEAIAARYAANLLGSRINHLYNKLSVDVQAAIVRDVETRALIVDPRLAERAAELVGQAEVEHVLFLGSVKDSVKDSLEDGEDLLELAVGQSAEPFGGLAQPEDVCSIRHTGGTTGHPKGICATFEQVSGMREQLSEVQEEVHRQLVCTTIAHGAGYLVDLTLSAGGSVVLQEDFEPAEVLATIERERITRLWLLPPLLYQMLDHPDIEHRDTSSLTSLIYGGCQASPVRLADAVRRLGPVLFQFYGQNEAGGVSVLTAEQHDPERLDRLRTAGKVLPGVEVAIRDEAGNDLPVGELGEICVRSRSVMQGYWKQPELTAEVLRGGWLHTGDLGRLDEDGFLTVVDRLKDMIIVVGGHVYTTELEDLLNSHPNVQQSAVFGVPDADRMEQVHAVVVPAPGGEVDERQLRDLVLRERGAMYEPARITFVSELPLTDVGKPDKKALRKAAEAAAA
ncbi:AMP-binding protein [Kitasatospora sp. HPMI-4]|uniref:AMP-binding protein n=1 Tax=Kitasatospora sp. HPMI-4 TaxID=3448443 RepID=UPI003F1E2046